MLRDLAESLFFLGMVVVIIKFGWQLVDWIMSMLYVLSFGCCLGIVALIGGAIYFFGNRENFF